MKLLLVAEGPGELNGALQTLVERLRGNSFDVECDKVSRQDLRAVHGKGKGYFKRAVRWLLEAERRQCDALVLVIDEDGETERCAQIDEAQEYAGTALPRALGVAIRTFDAWMLADEKGLAQVLRCTVRRQRDPERNRDPKRTVRDLCDGADDPPRLPELYAVLSKAIDLEVLEKRCAKGFGPFSQRVRAL